MSIYRNIFKKACIYIMIVVIVFPCIAVNGQNNISNAASASYIWPIKGAKAKDLSAKWGADDWHLVNLGRPHFGIDIPAAKGTSVYASSAGTVVEVGNNSSGYGKFVVIKHDTLNTWTLYGHNSAVHVKNKQKVKQGQKIASVGNTGASYGNHLHFGIYKVKNGWWQEVPKTVNQVKKVSLNPLNYLGKSTCTTHNYKNSKGKYTAQCQNCGAAYKDNDKADTSSKSTSTRYYKFKAATNIMEYPNSNSVVAKSKVTGTITVLGTVGSWYKVQTGKTVGYVPKTAVNGPLTKAPAASTLKVSVSGFTVKEEKAHTISGKVTSNYTISKITGTLGGQSQTITTKEFGKASKSVKIQGSLIDTNIKCKKLSAGTYTLTIKAWDSSGKQISATATVTVNGDVKVPSIGNEKSVEGGKTVVISKNSKQTSATLWYKIGDQNAKKATSNSVTTPTITKTTKVKAWCEINGKKSGTVTKEVSVNKLSEPSVQANQEGSNVNVVLKSSVGTAKIMYKIEDGTWKSDYKGQTLKLKNGQSVQYYAKAIGYINSAVGIFTADLTEPDAPVIKLIGDDPTIAVGRSVTISWDKDWKAASYKAVLYSIDEDGEEKAEETIETDKPSVSFKLTRAGKYYAEVTASNDLGESDASNRLELTAKDPLTVTFRDAGEIDDETGEENGEVITSILVNYGEKPEKVEEPSRRGHSFIGWENAGTGEISTNAYMKNAVKDDVTYFARYQKNKYKVRFYAPDGKYLMTNEVEFEENAVTEEVIDKLTQEGYINPGKAVRGWAVIKVADETSEADVNSVDSNMDVQAVIEWENADLPISMQIDSVSTMLDEDSEGVLFQPQVTIWTDESKTTEIYLVATLKGTDEESGVEKALYSDRRVFSIPKGETGLKLIADHHDFDLPVDAENANAVTKLELVALQKNSDGTTGSTYSELVEFPVTLDYGFTRPSAWSTERPEDAEDRVIETKTQYTFRDKTYVYSGKDTLAGYTKESTETISKTVGDWFVGTATGSDNPYDTYREVVTVQSKTAYKLYSKVCNCGKWAYPTKSGKCSYCGTNTVTNNKLKVFSSLPVTSLGCSKEADTAGINGRNGYKCPKTVTVGSGINGKGTVYCITFGHSTIQTLKTYTSKNAKGYLFLWADTDEPTTTVSQKTTTRTRNKFYKYGDWDNENHPYPDSESAWYDTPISSSSTREVKTRTLYRYRDKIDTPTVKTDLEGKVQQISGNLDTEEDLAGKKATIMVYQTNNTDPNRYQMQYTGQITLESDTENEDIGKNHYSFSFIPKDDPSVESGNYIVTLGVEGTTGLVRVGVIDAPKEKHDITISLTDGNEEIILSEQQVEDGSDVDMSSIEVPEKDGYYFIGWSHRTTNIKESCKIEAVYLPIRNTVVFVDWVNQTIDMRTAMTGEELDLPMVESSDEEDAAYRFRGWKKEDGTLLGSKVVVEGNMIITAEYDTATFTVNFIGEDGNIVDSQSVEYGQAAEPPEYTAEGGGVFVGWNTDVNWWKVESDVNVRPIIVYDEQALAPISRLVIDEDTEARSIVLETDEEGVGIYYTIDGTIPTAELIQEYLQTDPNEYEGSIKQYTEPITFPEEEGTSGEIDEEDAITDMNIIAVSYSEGKNASETCDVFFEKDPDEDEYQEDDSDWLEVGEYEVKASAGKDITISVDLEDNPGLTGYDFMIEGDRGTFYADTDDYGDPEVSTGVLSENGTVLTSDIENGWRITWNSIEASTVNGNIFSMVLHVDDEAEEGIYPMTVSYAPANTLNEDFDETELNDLKVNVSSEASIDLNTLDVVLARTSYVYEGQEIEPTVRIADLKEDDDYTVKYEENINVGTAKAIITGIGDYSGTVEKEFTITQANIANADLTSIPDQEWTGSTIEPDIPISFNGKSLEKSTDYEVVFTDNTEVGAATVSISGKGNFKGATDTSFNIVETAESRLEKAEAAINELRQQLEEKESEKQSLEQQLALAQSKEEELLAQKEALEQDAEANQLALTRIEAELEELSSEKEQLEANLQTANEAREDIEQQLLQALDEIEMLNEKLNDSTTESLAEVKVLGIKDMVYTGKAIEQNISVTVGSKKLEGGSDYEVEYINNTEVGTAIVTISGTGKYKGMLVRSFHINPKGTSLKKVKPGKKQATVTWKKQSEQTSGYQIRYSLKKNFKSGVKKVTVKKAKTTKKVIKKLKPNKTYYFQIRTYKTVNGDKLYSKWSGKKKIKVK